MLGFDWPRLHAALNHFPVALLVVAVLFDIGALITRRESLRSAALWTLWGGVIGGWAAVIAGLQAEDVIDHGEAIHDIMEPHQTFALVTMSIFTVVLAYKLFRRGNLSRTEQLLSRTLSFAGLVTIIWTAWLGGKMVYEHAAGVPTALLEPEIRNRALGRHHHGATGAAADSADSLHHHDGTDHDADHEH
jgi:uncharacterized membrane protein